MFIMLVGIAGSGKSTIAEKYRSKGYIIHSSDSLRKELFGDEEIQSYNDIVFNELHKRIKKDLGNNKDVLMDACNLSCKRRISFLQMIKHVECEKVCVVVATPYEDCLKQNQMRERKVPEEVIKRMYMSFEFPAYFEGWDNIDIYYNGDISGFTDDKIEALNTYDQHNPNHTLTLGGHMSACNEYLLSNTNNGLLCIAGRLHDIGKPFCQTYKNTKGEITDKAHYYNHQNVGAYLAMFYLYNTQFFNKRIVTICTYIQYHMQPYFNVTDKSKNKYLKLWGQELYDDIMLLHTADVSSH